jgi:hypothetical protein
MVAYGLTPYGSRWETLMLHEAPRSEPLAVAAVVARPGLADVPAAGLNDAKSVFTALE